MTAEVLRARLREVESLLAEEDRLVASCNRMRDGAAAMLEESGDRRRRLLALEVDFRALLELEERP